MALCYFVNYIDFKFNVNASLPFFAEPRPKGVFRDYKKTAEYFSA